VAGNGPVSEPSAFSPAPFSIAELFQPYRERLGLAYRVPPSVTAASEPMDTADGVVTALVGHMNLIRPNRVQVLGAAEIGYLNELAPRDTTDMLARLFALEPLCLIVADGLPVPDALTSAALDHRVPLITASVASHTVVGELLHALARLVSRRTSLHGVFIEVMGLGVLLTGAAGIGKSELALELITRGHRLIADDAPEFTLIAPDTVEGGCPPALRDFMEVRGLGIINVRALFGDSAVRPRRALRLIVALELMHEQTLQPEARLEGVRRSREVLGVAIPEVALPVAPGHNMAVLVEATVRNSILRMKGYDAHLDLSERQNRIMHGGES
jgi:HPr kinase/phosphorylase